MATVRMPEDVQIESYEDICSRDRELVADMDTKRWIIGDDASAVETRYGEHTMEDFARDINMNKSTVAGWKRVADFYPKFIRRNLLENYPNLSYSHLKDALRLKSFDEAEKWLREVSDNGWSPDQAAYELTEKLGHKHKAESIPANLESISERDGMCILEISIGRDDRAFIEQATELTIRAK